LKVQSAYTLFSHDDGCRTAGRSVGRTAMGHHGHDVMLTVDA